MEVERLFPYIRGRENFIAHEHPVYHPDTIEYENYWQDQEQKCIEGLWATETENYWRFMPPQLYFYIKVCKIIDQDEEGNSAEEISPFLDDTEWILGYDWILARGFSGFKDSNYSCHTIIEKMHKGIPLTIKENNRLKRLKHIYKEDGSYKDYKDKFEILYDTYDGPQGLPVYENEAKNLLWFGTRGLGKDLEENTLVHTLEGKIPIKDINIGDFIFGADGKLTKVISKKNYNDQLQYKVTFRDGRSLECGEGHLWTVFNKSKGKWETKELKEILKDYLRTERKDPNYFIPMQKAVEFGEKILPIDPYILGCWLGDGSKHCTAITTMDQEIVDSIYKEAEKEGEQVHKTTKPNNLASTYHISKGYVGGAVTGYRKKYIDLNLLNNKHIPEIYLRSSIEQRMELLRGLMDTDGWCGKTDGACQYFTSCPLLKKGVEELLLSLGIRFKIRRKKTTHKDSYVFNIITSKNIFKLPRKLERLNKNPSAYALSNRNKVAIVDISPLEIKPSVCIGVDNEDSLFLAGDYIVTHNSFFGISCVLHEWYFFGQRVFDPTQKLAKVELLVSAAISSKSIDLLSKAKLTMDYIQTKVGSYRDTSDIKPIFTPGYFHLDFSGTMDLNDELVQHYQEKNGDTWVTAGIGSTLAHLVATTSNPAIAAGKRNNVILFEEIGLAPNILDILSTSKDSMKRKGKFGTFLGIGTSGFVDKVEGLKVIMLNPDEHDFLSCPDIFEGRPKNVARFLPAYLADRTFKDEFGNTKYEEALASILEERKVLAKADTTHALDDEILNRPITISEMFSTKGSSKLPVSQMKERKLQLELTKSHEKVWSIGWLHRDKYGKVYFKHDTEGKLKPILTYDIKAHKKDYKGAMIFYEHPPDILPVSTYTRSLYKVTYDPVKDDHGGTSLCSVIVYKGFPDSSWEGGYSDTIVAEYVGRLDKVNDMHEIAFMMAEYYGANLLPEINIPDVVRYAEMTKRYHMLQPCPLLAIGDVVNNPGKKYAVGIDMTSPRLQEHSIQLLAQWLLSPIGKNSTEIEDDEEDKKNKNTAVKERTNVDNINSLRFLDEGIIYGGPKSGNYDHLRSFMILALWLSQEEKEEISPEENKRDMVDLQNILKRRRNGVYRNIQNFVNS